MSKINESMCTCEKVMQKQDNQNTSNMQMWMTTYLKTPNPLLLLVVKIKLILLFNLILITFNADIPLVSVTSDSLLEKAS